MIRIFLMLCFLLGILSCQKKNEKFIEALDEIFNETNKEPFEKICFSGNESILGTYHKHGFNSSQEIELKETGEFLYQGRYGYCMGGGRKIRIHGYFELENKVLRLTPISKVTIRIPRNEMEVITKDSILVSPIDTMLFPESYHLVKWDSNYYFLSDKQPYGSSRVMISNQFEYFANNYNSGSEPIYSHSYYSKKKQNYHPSNPLDTMEILPKYRKLFLEKPITAKIIAIDSIVTHLYGDEYDTTYEYKINKGKRDGVFEKMKFFRNKKSSYCCDFRIHKVENEVSYAKGPNCITEICGIGTLMKTIDLDVY